MAVSTPDQTHSVCRQLRAGEPFTGKQGLQYAVGISAESVGAQAIHMQLLTIPPGGRAFAHKHATHETAIYAVSRRLSCLAWRAAGAPLHRSTGRFLLYSRRCASPALQPQRDGAGDRDHRPHRPERTGERGPAAGT